MTSGKYDFTLTNPTTGVVGVANARFTYVFDSSADGKVWKIKVHHSSLLPAAPPAANLRSQDLSWINQDIHQFKK